MCQSKEEKEEMLVMRRYRRKPLSIEAVQWGGSTTWNDLVKFTNHLVRYEGELASKSTRFFVYDRLHDTWVEFTHKDWIIKGTQNEFYPIKDDVFRECYELEGTTYHGRGMKTND